MMILARCLHNQGLVIGSLLVLSSSLNLTLAQDFWTVQMAAFSDYRDATQAVNQLQAQGLDSYSEFFMQEGKQLVRVRIGCFDSKPTAEQFAKTSLLTDASIVPMTQGSPIDLCVTRAIGAMLPQDTNNWGVYQENQAAIEFWFRAQDITAFLAFNGSSWNLSDQANPLDSNQVSQSPGYFREDSGYIKLFYPNRRVFTLTSGKLIWQYGLSAVILEDNILAAYQLSLSEN